MISKDDIAAVLDSLPADKRPVDGAACAKVLVREKKLTVYQAQQIYAGKGSSLVLGNYVIEDKIGQGGMGQVFKARHKRMDRMVAIKLLPREVYKDDAVVKRFHREVKAAAKLTHPHIVIAYDADEAPGGIHFLVMEYVEGRDLSQILHDEKTLPVDRVVNYTIQAARGLAYAHGKGIVHRDIKPANLLLDSDGTVKILDMGLARIHGAATQAAAEGITKSGDVMGTIDYMAPEQAFDTHTADGRADIYSLGCTLYRLLTGQNLYEAETMVQKLMAHQSKPIPSIRQNRSDAPEALEAVYQRMVAKKADERYQHMNEVIAALEALVRSDSDSSFVFSRSDTSPNSQPTAVISRSPALDEPTSQFESGEYVAVALVAAESHSPTVTLKSSTQGTDPVSERSIDSARSLLVDSLKPQVAVRKPPRRNNWTTKLIAAGFAGAILLLGTWLVIKDKDGNEIARVQVPEGGQIETLEDKTNSNAQAESADGLPSPVDPFSVGLVPVAERWPFDPTDGKEYVWSTPENLGAGVNTTVSERFAGISDDGLELYFTRGNTNMSYRSQRKRVDDSFGDAKEIPKFDDVLRVFYAANGSAVAIERKNERNRCEVWLSPQKGTSESLGESLRKSEPVYVDDRAQCPALSPDGLTLLVGSQRIGSQSSDIWMLTRKAIDEPFSSAERLPEPVNTPTWDMPWYVSNDRCFVIASSQKVVNASDEGNQARKTLRFVRYFTRSKPTDPFGPGLPLSIPLGQAEDSDTNEGFRLSSDGRTIYFSSAKLPGGVGIGDLWVSRRVLKPVSGPQPVAPSSTTSGLPGSMGQPIDLLALVDVNRDAVMGTWTLEVDGLSVKPLGSSQADRISRLQLPYQPPEEYDFEIEFTPLAEGGFALSQYFVFGGVPLAWDMDANPATSEKKWLSGFTKQNSVSLAASPDAVRLDTRRLKAGVRQRSRVEVRRGTIRAFVDEQEIISLDSDIVARLPGRRQDSNNALRDPLRLGVAANLRKAIFHKITVHEITGRGKFTDGVKPASEPPQASIEAATIRDEAVTYAGHRYLLVDVDRKKFGERITWEKAKAEAESLGGHLVTITSKAEYDFVHDHVMKKIWSTKPSVRALLGGYIPAGGGKPKWITDEPFDTQFLKDDKPKRSKGDRSDVDHGIMWRSDYWEVTTASAELAFYIVEWDTPTAATLGNRSVSPSDPFSSTKPSPAESK